VNWISFRGKQPTVQVTVECCAGGSETENAIRFGFGAWMTTPPTPPASTSVQLPVTTSDRPLVVWPLAITSHGPGASFGCAVVALAAGNSKTAQKTMTMEMTDFIGTDPRV
jgi:hypothetical protein